MVRQMQKFQKLEINIE